MTDKYVTLAGLAGDLADLGWKRPKVLDAAAATWAAARSTTRNRPAPADVPLTPDNVVGVMTDYAIDLAAAEHRAAALAQVDGRLALDVRVALRADAANIHKAMAKRYDALAATFVEALPLVPPGMDPVSLVDAGGEVVDAANTLRRTALELDRIVALRASLARVLGDPDDKAPEPLRWVATDDDVVRVWPRLIESWSHAERWRKTTESGFRLRYVTPVDADAAADLLRAASDRSRADAARRQAEPPSVVVFS
ncbi:MAG: hypothetical protein R2737_10340 [Candidatus Nanopelagicales bacterium]